MDCNACPCYEPRVANRTCSTTENVVKCAFCNPGYLGDKCDSCEDFHYGNPVIIGELGTCTPCNCNGNSNSCNPSTGECIGCGNNTEGTNCERCITGYYMNTETNNCEVCGCDTGGSTSTICDPADGTCTCYPGVGGRTCNGCLENYWRNQQSPGCLQCDCIEAGSTSQQCADDTGICTCKSEVLTTSGKCDECVAGYFGLPNQECQICGCNTTGTDPTAGTCDLVTGQCPCRPGVTGRKCDRCKTLYIDFSNTGCTACDKCQSSLGNDTTRLHEMWNFAYIMSQDVDGIQKQDIILQGLDEELNTTMTKLGLSGTDISSVGEMTDNITQFEEETKQQVDTLKTKVTTLKSDAENQKDITFTEDERLKILLGGSLNMLDSARLEEQKGINYQYTLNEHNISAQQFLGQGVSNQESMGLNFDAQLNKATADYQTIRDDQSVEDMLAKTSTQATAIESLRSAEASVGSSFNSLSDRMSDRYSNLTSLESDENVLLEEQAQAQALKDQAVSNYDAILSATATVTNISTTASSMQSSAATAHSDCQQIMDGNAAGVLTGVVFPSGVSDWNTAYAELQTIQGNMGAQVSSTDDDVKETERRAQELDTEAKLLNTTFYDIQLRGDAAVKAIANFETVIQSLNSSVELADLAKATITEAQQAVDTLTVAGLEEQATTSRTLSSQVLESVNSVRYDSTVLNSQLGSAESNLKVALDQWPAVDGQLDTLQQSAESLSSQTGGTDVRNILSEAQTLALEANGISSNTISVLSTLNVSLSAERAKAEAGKEQVDRAVNLTRTVEQEANSFPGKVDALTLTVETAGQHRDYIETRKPILDAKITSIEEKVIRARQLLANLRKPVKFNGTSGLSLTNPSSSLSRSFTDIQFKFKKDQTVTNALLFFSENTAGSDMFSVEVVGDQVQMEFSSSEGNAVITSQAELCHDCWFQVQASKYRATGHLTLTLLSSGGKAYNTGMSSSQNTDNGIILNSPLRFGSLPPDTTSTKLTSTSGFQGCMHDVNFNGEYINIWGESVLAGNPPTCCQTPAPIVSPSLDPGTSFDGFGELILESGSLDVNLVSSVSLKFRTFNPNAVLLLVGGDNLPVKFTLHLSEGRLVFEYGNISGIENRIQSSNTYNTGLWYQVIATKGGQNVLQVFQEDRSPAETAVTQTANPVVLSALTGVSITIGSDATENSVNLPTLSKRFSGCMKGFFYTYTGDPLQRSFQDGVVRQSGASHSGCLSNIVPGIRFLSDSSYLKLGLPTLTSINTIELKLATTQANGVLLYIQDVVTTSRRLYLCLLNGNLVLETRGIITSLSTRNSYISDGLLHTVLVDISSSPLIEIDDSNQFLGSGQVQFSKTGSTPVFVGGSDPRLDDSFPVRSSFIGGINSFKINGNEINIFEAGAILQNTDIHLGGIPEPANAPPPLPYTTPEPPPIPTCGVQPTFPGPSSTFNLWFVGNGYWKKTLSDAEKNSYIENFSLSIRFESFGPDGVVLMAADSMTAPTEYLLVYLKEGYLYFVVKSPNFTMTLQSNFLYNDAVKYTVDFLVYGTYLVMTESEFRKEYQSNDQGDYGFPPIFTKILEISVGGLPDPSVGNSLLAFLPTNTGFQGGISEVTVHAKAVGTITYDLQSSTGVTSLNVMPYPGPDVGYGVHLSGINSFINFSDISVSSQLVVGLTLRNIAPSAMLFYIYRSANQFVSLDTVEYKIRVSVGSTTSVSAFTAISTDLTNFCDGLSHTYLLALNSTGVSVKVDSNPGQFYSYPENFPTPVFTGPAIVGGLTDTGQTFQTEVSKVSLKGCVQNVVINGAVKDPAQFLTGGSGAALGCPYVNPYN